MERVTRASPAIPEWRVPRHPDCAPCLSRICPPYRGRAYLLQLGKEIPIVGLNWPANNSGERDAAAAMLRRQGNPYHLVIIDEQGRMTTDLGVYGAPETFLIAADGTILHRHAGPIDAHIWQNDFQPLLGGKP